MKREFYCKKLTTKISPLSTNLSYYDIFFGFFECFAHFFRLFDFSLAKALLFVEIRAMIEL